MDNQAVLTRLHRLNIDSEQLRLAPLCQHDVALYCQLMCNQQALCYIHPPLTHDAALQSFNRSLACNLRAAPIRYIYTVQLRQGGDAIGIAALNSLDVTAKHADIGRILLPQWQAKGLGTELSSALMAALTEAFDIRCFIKKIREDNVPAMLSANKLGFVKTTEHHRTKGMLWQTFQRISDGM